MMILLRGLSIALNWCEKRVNFTSRLVCTQGRCVPIAFPCRRNHKSIMSQLPDCNLSNEYQTSCMRL